MQYIRKNVERMAITQEQAAKLEAEGFVRINAAGTKPSKEPVPKAAKSTAEQRHLEDMTTAQLRAAAKEKGLQGYQGLSREELLRIIKDVV